MRDSRGERRLTVTFLLIRHAAHVDLDKRLSGRLTGVPLSVAGMEQAAALGRALANTSIDRIECSPLERTRQTAEAIASAIGAPAPQESDALIEIDMGDWTGACFADLAGQTAWDRWNTERGTARIPGGETMAEAQARIASHMRGIAATSPDGATIALVTHSDMIRAAVADVIGLPLSQVVRFAVDPASVSRVAVGDWGGHLHSLNERIAA